MVCVSNFSIFLQMMMMMVRPVCYLDAQASSA